MFPGVCLWVSLLPTCPLCGKKSRPLQSPWEVREQGASPCPPAVSTIWPSPWKPGGHALCPGCRPLHVQLPRRPSLQLIISPSKRTSLEVRLLPLSPPGRGFPCTPPLVSVHSGEPLGAAAADGAGSVLKTPRGVPRGWKWTPFAGSYSLEGRSQRATVWGWRARRAL